MEESRLKSFFKSVGIGFVTGIVVILTLLIIYNLGISTSEKPLVDLSEYSSCNDEENIVIDSVGVSGYGDLGTGGEVREDVTQGVGVSEYGDLGKE